MNNRRTMLSIAWCWLALGVMAAHASATSPAAVVSEWLSDVQQRITSEEYRFQAVDERLPSTVAGTLTAPNRVQNLRVYVGEEGVRVVPRIGDAGGWTWGLSLVGIRRGTAGEAVSPGTVCSEGDRVELARNGLTEYFVNGRDGLKHGLIIPERPQQRAASNDSLVLIFRCEGQLAPLLEADAARLIFLTRHGSPVLRYDGLTVLDAAGRVLPAHFEVDDERLRIVIDDAGAAYPIHIDPVATTANWSAVGGQAGAQLGFATAAAGDVNGDGYGDVIVGVPFFDNGQVDEGRAYVYLGTATGLQMAPVWQAEGNLAGCRFGEAVSTAGDVNGDGYSDILIGAGAFTNTQTHEGRVFVYHGSASGPGVTANWIAQSGQDSALMGSAVGCAGDVNGDGYSDVIVGVPYYDHFGVNNGVSLIWFGSATGLGPNGTVGNADWFVSGDQNAALFGSSVAGAGDVNGDGYSDVIIGAPNYDNGEEDEGRVFVFHGGPAGPSSIPTWSTEGDQEAAYFGRSVGTAGDVNGDGYSDVIVGAPLYDNGETNEGRAFVFQGSAGGLGGTAAWSFESNQTNANCGFSAGCAGDVNGDGYADVIVGAYQYGNTLALEGRADVFLGGVGGLALMPAWTVYGGQEGGLFGYSVATAGDVNGDGMSDILVGSIYHTDSLVQEGRVQVFHGSAGGLSVSAGWMVESDQAGAEMGISVASAGDVNGDGYGDVLVGAELYDNGQTNEGRAYLYFGGAAGLETTPGWIGEINSAFAEYGVSVACAGDVNGDGYDDIIIGAWQYTNGETREGGVFLYHGGPSGPSLTPDWQYESNQANSWMGRAAETAGDVNGDGFADVIVSNSAYSNPEPIEGRALVFFGSPTGLSLSPDWSAESNQANTFFSRAVNTAGDVNGDGYSDIIIGAYNYSNGESTEGSVFVWYGSATGLGPDGTPENAAWRAEANQVNANMGVRASTAGDVNGDGYSDIIVGVRRWSNPEFQEGGAMVWYGGPGGLGPNGTPENADWIVESNQADAQMGNAAATSGDVNGDGYSDVIVGAWLYDNGESNEGRAFVYLGSSTGLSTLPAWTAEPNLANAQFGWSVASAGDVNGDGYGDVIVGALSYTNGEANEGAAFLYYGNDGAGLSLRPQQRRADNSAPIARLGLSDSQDKFRLAATGRSPFGRGRVRLQWEVKPLGSGLDGTNLSTATTWSDSGLSGASLNEQVTGLIQGNLYHWRVRVRYDAATAPLQGWSRWVQNPLNGWHESDVRTPVPAPQVLVDPLSAQTCVGWGPVSFSVTATGAVPLSYQWRKDTFALSDGGRISGAETSMLVIAPPMTLGDAGDYDCVVTNFVGMDVSGAASLLVWPVGSGDVNVDGQTNADDIEPFVSALIMGTPTEGHCTADMNGDGKLDGLDIAPFVDVLTP